MNRILELRQVAFMTNLSVTNVPFTSANSWIEQYGVSTHPRTDIVTPSVSRVSYTLRSCLQINHLTTIAFDLQGDRKYKRYNHTNFNFPTGWYQLRSWLEQFCPASKVHIKYANKLINIYHSEQTDLHVSTDEQDKFQVKADTKTSGHEMRNMALFRKVPLHQVLELWSDVKRRLTTAKVDIKAIEILTYTLYPHFLQANRGSRKTGLNNIRWLSQV